MEGSAGNFRDCSRIALSPAHVEQFTREGFTVVDGFFGETWATQLASEAQRLAREGLLLQHRFQFAKVLVEKPNIFELDLDDEQRRALCPELNFIHQTVGPALVEVANRHFPWLQLTNAQAIKLQYNKGQGGCFPWHYDNPGPPSRRQLTCICYLNGGWSEEHGGQLVLWPFLGSPVTIAPKLDRVVFFRSDLLLHRVMRSQHERFCFTIWVDGASVNAAEDVLLTRDTLQFPSWDDAALAFQRSPLQRVISRAVYHEDYEQSLLECVLPFTTSIRSKFCSELECWQSSPCFVHLPGSIQTLVATHTENVTALNAKLGPLIAEMRRRQQLIGTDAVDFDTESGEGGDDVLSLL